ncbi:hypothetical protein TGAM01_v202297 [Trichoderma gamsii]|uniref:Uncharacterized protein n=1 Tax=Trichoderma gamsii TaxID=398673 RepID=A0A2P4ZY11_9HYPO|nr:hypothetical protein TGAM01_v202297 [Trichoderma gamsii]PON29189.1 hypothetical protein TGAM01_v202297 [Trichoderma gamsii]
MKFISIELLKSNENIKNHQLIFDISPQSGCTLKLERRDPLNLKDLNLLQGNTYGISPTTNQCSAIWNRILQCILAAVTRDM